MEKNKIDKAFAEKELIRFADACGVEITPEEITAERGEKGDETGPLNRLIKRITVGDFKVDEAGAGHYTMKKPAGSLTECKFEEADGADHRELDKRGAGEENHKAMQCFIASVIGCDPSDVSKAKKRDLIVLTDVAKLFLG